MLLFNVTDLCILVVTMEHRKASKYNQINQTIKATKLALKRTKCGVVRVVAFNQLNESTSLQRQTEKEHTHT